MSSSTIVAIATPQGFGGVGIVRLSGPLALTIAKKMTRKAEFGVRQAHYASFYSEEGYLIDLGLCLYFKAPNSFTGEEIVEFQVHGSPIMLDQLLKSCVAYGAELAKPGEFSERAFLNDKMDLTQAEAVADLIHASSFTAAQMALRTLQGEFSQRIAELNQELVHLRMYVEAAIDFPEEEIDFLSDGKVAGMLDSVIEKLRIIQSEANQGAILREGITLVIAGLPNAGKSTLINRLAGKEVAIVTEIPGTTRDVMREQILLDDIPVHIVDTAGLRETEDIVEKEGIKRAWQAISQADCVLLLVDIQDKHRPTDLMEQLQQTLPKQVPILTILNKMDTLALSDPKSEDALCISAKSGEGIRPLINKIKDCIGYHPEQGHYLARRRHLLALESADRYLQSGQQQLVTSRAGELLAEDLRLAHLALGEITGEFSSDDLLGKIFSSFCIGK